MEELTVKAESVVRMEETGLSKKGLHIFNVTDDMQDQMNKNGTSLRDGIFGNLYHKDVTGELYIIMTTEKPEGWDDPSVKAKKKKK